jgi:hypothetical protein
VPQEFRRPAEHFADGVMRVVITVRAGKYNNAEFHALILVYGRTETQPAIASPENFSISFGPGTMTNLNYNTGRRLPRAGHKEVRALSLAADLRYLLERYQ